MMTKRVQRAIGTFVFLTTCFVTPTRAMESENRVYEPAGRHDHPAAPTGDAEVIRSPALLEDSRQPTGPAFRTGDGSHPAIAPYLSRDIRPGEIPRHDTGAAGIPVWRW